MNYIPKIAEMLGVGIGEEFDILDEDGDIAFYKYRLTHFGLCKIEDNGSDGEYHDDLLVRLLNGYFKAQRPVLTYDEKKKLYGVISPWGSEVKDICKLKSVYDGYEFLVIKFKTEVGVSTTASPQFRKGSMYKGMELEREYSLEELDL